MAPKLKTVLSGSALILAALAFFHRLTFTREILIARDVLRVYYPVRAFWADQVAHGKFPGWYPYESLGVPFAGSLVTGAFHPINLVYLFLPLTTAVKFNALICYVIAFWGAYLFLRNHARTPTASAVGATLFSFSGYLVSMTNNLLYLMSAAFIPWVLFAVKRLCQDKQARFASLLALFLSSMLLAGDPQCFVLSAAAALTGAIFWSRSSERLRPVTLTILGLGTAALICSAQIISSWPVIQEGSAAQRGLLEAEIWSLNPLRILDIALGNFSNVPEKFVWNVSLDLFDTGALGFWADALYVGLPALALAVLGLANGKRDRTAIIALVLGGVFLGLALGKHTPLYGFLFRHLPGWPIFRYPEKIYSHFLIWLCVLISTGFDALIDFSARSKRRVGLTLIVTGAVLLAARLGPFLQRELSLLKLNFRADSAAWDPLAVILEGQLLKICLHSAMMLTLFGLLLLLPRLDRFLKPLLFALVAADIASVTIPVYRTAEPEMISTVPGFVEVMKQNRDGMYGSNRMFSGSETFQRAIINLEMSQIVNATLVNAMVPDTNALWQIENAAPYLPGTSARVKRLENDRALWWGRFMSMANVAYVTVNAVDYEQMHGRADRRLAMNQAFQLLLLSNPNRLARAYLARLRCARNAEESFRIIAGGTFMPGEEAVLECGTELRPANHSSSTEGVGAAAITEYSPADISIDVRATEQAALVLADAYYSGWSATIDGAPTPILPANHAFRGVIVNPGHHVVRFTYQVPHLVWGALVSSVALILCLITWLSVAFRRARVT